MLDYNTIPNEIFVEIFASSSTDSPFLSSISLVNRRFHSLVEPILYKLIHLSGDRSLPSAIQQFLRTVVSRPLLASYVRLLNVDWVHPLQATLGVTSDSQDLHELRIFSAAARSAGLLHSVESQGAQVALLVHLLPNLLALDVFPPRNYPNDAPDIFYLMLAEYAFLPTTSLPIGLRYMRTVSFGAGGSEVSPKALLTILKLPCIREVYVHITADLDEILTTSPIATAFATGTSTVTNLEFGYGAVNTYSLARIITMPRTLTRFSYTSCDSVPGSFKCAVFGMALQRFRGTLQELVLRFRSVIDETDGDEQGTLGSLRDWPVLKFIRCSLTALVGRAAMGGVAQLREVLPLAAESIAIDEDGDWVHWKVTEQMVDLVEGGEFGRLKEVVLAGKGDVVEGKVKTRLLEACDSAGVELSIYRAYEC